MAVAENAAPKNDLSSQNLETNNNDLERSSKPRNDEDSAVAAVVSNGKGGGGGDDGGPQEVRANGHYEADQKQQRHQEEEEEEEEVDEVVGGDGKVGIGAPKSGGFGRAYNSNTNDNNNSNGHLDHDHHQHDHDMNELVEILSKLNPLAEEFVPPSLVNVHGHLNNGFGFVNNFVRQTGPGNANGQTNWRKKNNHNQGRRRMNSRMSAAQREEMIRRTVYVSDIDQQVTEEQLAGLFANCGQVVDCRVCGDPNSILRFAFIEFTDEESVRAALTLSGTVLGFYPLRVLPSKTAIAPVNPTFLPRSEDEREMCARTIYCTNIDRKVTQVDVKLFFESFCGEVQRLRISGDHHHSTRIAFIEFTMAESAIAALNCSGAVLGSLPIRVSPSKTPVRPRMPRSPLH